MANKMSTILSFIFITIAILLAGDIIGVQLAYTQMDDVSMTAGYMLSKEGDVDKVIEFVTSKEMDFVSNTSRSPMFGETYEFTITRTYRTLVMSKNPLLLKINRTTVIGYYY